jgi:DtxR family Mn-dependent transcriptional regulator
MAEHLAETPHEHTSESEEMYLITTARALEEGISEPVPLSRLAGDLDVSAVSANQMIRKLENRGFVEYAPYKGVSLTNEGRRVAHSILRRRRLWGVFLTDRLGLSPMRADAIACDMEHITPADVADLLAEFLDNPTVGPTGRPIPVGGEAVTPHTVDLRLAPAGQPLVVVAIDAPAAAASFLRDHGVTPGTGIEIIALAADGSLLVAVGTDQVRLAPAAGEWVRVEEP